MALVNINLQFFGGRGASSGGGSSNGNTFRSASDLEKSLTGVDDPRYSEYESAYSAESSYNKGLKNNMGRAIDEDGYTQSIDQSLKSEEKMTKDQLKSLPKMKTPSQIGTEEALKERLDIINDLKGRKGEKGKGSASVNIVYNK